MVDSSSLTKIFMKTVGNFLIGGFLLLCQIWIQSSGRKDFLTKLQDCFTKVRRKSPNITTDIESQAKKWSKHMQTA